MHLQILSTAVTRQSVAADARGSCTYVGLREMNRGAEPDANQTTVITSARLIDGRGGPPDVMLNGTWIERH